MYIVELNSSSNIVSSVDIVFPNFHSGFRCASHSADGTLKRLAKSQTMSVEKVTLLYTTLRSVTKHFEMSPKSKEILDKCFEILDMSSISVISWCGTRMAHFLDACEVMGKILPALYDTMYTCGIKPEERDRFLSTTFTLFIC